MRLIDFVPLGPRYSSSILNLIINLIKKVLDPSKKQIILATVTSVKEFEQLGMLRYFKHVFTLEKLNTDEISNVLVNLGFKEIQAKAIGREVRSSSVNELVDITKINGKFDEIGWMECWK